MENSRKIIEVWNYQEVNNVYYLIRSEQDTKLTDNASVELNSHCYVTMPRQRLNTDIASHDWSFESICHDNKTIVITSKNLITYVFIGSENQHH